MRHLNFDCQLNLSKSHKGLVIISCVVSAQCRNVWLGGGQKCPPPCEKGLRKTLHARAKSVCLLKSKLKTMKTRFLTSPKGLGTFQKTKKALALLEGVVPSELLDFIKTQVHLSDGKTKGRRYVIAFKAWALTLYHISGKAYTSLAKLYHQHEH